MPTRTTQTGAELFIVGAIHLPKMSSKSKVAA